MVIAVACVGLNFVLNIVFVLTWPAPIRHAGLAFATVLASAVNGGVLAWFVNRRFGSPGWRKIVVSFLKCLAAAVVMAIAARWTYDFVYGFRSGGALPIKYYQFVGVAAAIVAGLVVYTVTSWGLRIEELRGFVGLVFRGRRRK